MDRKFNNNPFSCYDRERYLARLELKKIRAFKIQLNNPEYSALQARYESLHARYEEVSCRCRVYHYLSTGQKSLIERPKDYVMLKTIDEKAYYELLESEKKYGSY